MNLPTIVPGMLRVASAVPDPPFELERDGALAGFDIDLMKAVCADLDLAWHRAAVSLSRHWRHAR
jgi:ABC-type amino acid transport substrate-binding protein